jgi:hypothetical protein
MKGYIVSNITKEEKHYEIEAVLDHKPVQNITIWLNGRIILQTTTVGWNQQISTPQTN